MTFFSIPARDAPESVILLELSFPVVNRPPNWNLIFRVCRQSAESTYVYYTAHQQMDWPNSEGIFVPPQHIHRTYSKSGILKYLRDWLDLDDSKIKSFIKYLEQQGGAISTRVVDYER